MTREELKAKGYTPEQINELMDMNGESINAIKLENETLTNERNNLTKENDTLKTRNSELEKIDVKVYENKLSDLQSEFDTFKATSTQDLALAKEQNEIDKIIHTSGTNDTEVLSLLVKNHVSALERNEDTNITDVVSGLVSEYKETKPNLFATTPITTGAKHNKTPIKKELTAEQELKERLFPNTKGEN